MRTAAETAREDQMRAACAELDTILAKVAASAGTTPIDIPHDGWFGNQAKAFLDLFRAGNVQACRHVASSPTACMAAVWKPGIVVCFPCSAFALRAAPEEDNRCDRCRRHTDRIFPGSLPIGPVALAYGLCRQCSDDLGVRQGRS